jgi:hypothetical protein
LHERLSIILNVGSEGKTNSVIRLHVVKLSPWQGLQSWEKLAGLLRVASITTRPSIAVRVTGTPQGRDKYRITLLAVHDFYSRTAMSKTFCIWRACTILFEISIKWHTFHISRTTSSSQVAFDGWTVPQSMLRTWIPWILKCLCLRHKEQLVSSDDITVHAAESIKVIADICAVSMENSPLRPAHGNPTSSDWRAKTLS